MFAWRPTIKTLSEEARNKIKDYENQFNSKILDSLPPRQKVLIYNQGLSVLNLMYSKGILDKEYNYPNNTLVTLLENRNQVGTTNFSDFIKPNFRDFAEKSLVDINLSGENFQNVISLFFDIVKPNVSLNESITNNSLLEELNKISLVRGSIEK